MESYNEKYRPQFHFTYKKGWLGDINGLVCYRGEYHLFSQHNPAGPQCHYPNIHWGHAISNDLVHWRELPPALKPDSEGPVFSGTCVVDWDNTSGLQTGDENVIIAFYTAGGYILPENRPGTQCMAYSNDRGRTWTKYSGNPIIKDITHYNRDPKVFWYKPAKKWIMVITLSCAENWLEGDYRFAFFSSPDLKQWDEISRFEMPRGIDCPDMFELPVDSDPENTRWVFWAGDGTHAIGTFDGIEFKCEGDIHLPLIQWDKNGANGYAAQTFSDMPAEDGRVIQISWLRNLGAYPDNPFKQENDDSGVSRSSYPEMPFDQQASFPCELTLREFPEGIILCREPVKEIELLHSKHHHLASEDLPAGENPLADISGELFNIRADIELGTAAEIGFKIRGVDIFYNVKKKKLSCMDASVHMEPTDGRIQLQILVDRTSIEIFGNNGRVSMSMCLFFDPENKTLQMLSSQGAARIALLDLYELKSAWS